MFCFEGPLVRQDPATPFKPAVHRLESHATLSVPELPNPIWSPEGPIATSVQHLPGYAVSAEVQNDLHVAVHRSPPYIRSPEKSSIDSRPKWYSESIAAG